MATYNVNPTPGSGSGAFGSVPGAVALPKPYQNFGQVFPGLQGTSTAASSGVLNELEGQLSPDTLASIQNQGAAWGVASGMPGSGVQHNLELLNAATASQGQQAQGLKNYQSVVSPESRYLTVAPSTEAEIAETNAINAAAPNPTLAGLTNIGSAIAGLGFRYAIGNNNNANPSVTGEPGQSYDTLPGYNADTGVYTNPDTALAGYAENPDAFTSTSSAFGSVPDDFSIDQ